MARKLPYLSSGTLLVDVPMSDSRLATIEWVFKNYLFSNGKERHVQDMLDYIKQFRDSLNTVSIARGKPTVSAAIALSEAAAKDTAEDAELYPLDRDIPGIRP